MNSMDMLKNASKDMEIVRLKKVNEQLVEACQSAKAYIESYAQAGLASDITYTLLRKALAVASTTAPENATKEGGERSGL